MTSSIIERIDEWAQKTPDKACYDYQGVSLSYHALKQQSDALAVFFLKEAKQNREPIVIYGHMDPLMPIAFMAALKSGHAYVPVDVSMPSERIEQIIRASNPCFVLAVEDLPNDIQFESVVLNRKLIESIIETTDGAELTNENFVRGEDNHYIIYTSGSTGMPKGVQISQNNLVSFSNWLLQDFSLSQGLRFLNQAPYSFDLSVMDLYPCLLSGGTLVPVDKSITSNLKELYAALPMLGLNIWVSTPSFMDIALLSPDFNAENCDTLTTFIFCGEVLTKETARELLRRFPEAKVFNTYGPTEATVAVTEIEVTEAVIDAYPSLPLGKVKPDTRLLIVDPETHQPVEAGEKGEIVLVGPSVSNGYLNEPEKTAKVFERVGDFNAYYTGDCGMLLDGYLFFYGRLDFQIKLHGYRIELEDIENNLKEVSYIRSAVVIPKFVSGKVDSLVAFVVPHPHEFDKPFKLSKAIKEELAFKMPSYMIPRKWVYKEEFILTNNGKIDRKVLNNEVNE
ncbi:D-alanine--poly(phosphoribitol) ligase subunit 1 [Listeria floridensis FSL S10-1187]|uniref:D-alanine--D-alanyl carrier protein ligase n=1 Tax=Listeria floridensis FSL S10-1187 TaxID=1265817 RepID=A0ABN0RFJ7_9LIST|nr:D-alanine--poly(phosphoribitol) ligase subunit DltA [Listeria floridensis]EUJ32197.1 D-alanine--poly(phosphoribitol) ligase subunit 1 [Listeria floridensis FSL S10-1187]